MWKPTQRKPQATGCQHSRASHALHMEQRQQQKGLGGRRSKKRQVHARGQPLKETFSFGHRTTVTPTYVDFPKEDAPDMPSRLLQNRIVYLDSPIVPEVVEIVVSSMLHLRQLNKNKRVYLYINSPGCCRTDGEVMAWDWDAIAIYDCLHYFGMKMTTLGTGICYGHAALLLSMGDKGKRYATPSTAIMLHQPRLPDSGQRYSDELFTNWVIAQDRMDIYTKLLSEHTGQSREKLERDLVTPLLMYPTDAIQYGLIDKMQAPKPKVQPMPVLLPP